MKQFFKILFCLLLVAVFTASCGKSTELTPGDDSPNDFENTTPDNFDDPDNEQNKDPDDPVRPKVGNLRINEVLSDNSVYRFSGNTAYKFIELYNYGSETMYLDGCKLSIGGSSADLTGQIAPGEYLLIFPGAEVPAELGISALTVRFSSKCTLTLTNSDQEIVDTLTLPELEKDCSYAYKAPVLGTYTTDDYVVTSFVTPGYENSISGLESWYEANDQKAGLVINEAMSSNREYVNTLGTYYDWIELKNISGESINLSSYYLSDKQSKLQKYRLPDKVLKPGETIFIYAESDEAELLTSRGYICCGFSLSADREQIYLSDAEGNILDAMVVMGTTQNGSYGRMDGKSGFYYFETPTPNADNQNGIRCITTTPVFSNAGGVYNDVNEMVVTIKGEGTIYYTLDGSVPTVHSQKYAGQEIAISKTGVIRAISVVDGKITGRAATASFVLNENHKLPVLSIAIDPEDMYGDKTGIYVVGTGNNPDAWAGEANYTKGWEKTAHAIYFDENGIGFSLDCGIKIAGSGTKAFPKKSFQLKFRGIYGASELAYDFFGTGVESFQNIKLRCGEDYFRTTFRDELQAALVWQMNGLLAQRYRWFILYINGEYFGLYAFRDMTDENYVAKAENAEPVDVLILEHDGVGEIAGKRDYYKEFLDFVNDCYTMDLTIEENYRYVTDRIDIESLTKWFIARFFSQDRDWGNCRFYRVGDDGKWKLIFYDADWGFYYMYVNRSPYDMITSQTNANAYPLIRIMRGLLSNVEYRNYFLTELAQQLKTVYSPENIIPIIESFDAELRVEIPRDRERWYDKDHPGTYAKYLYMYEELIQFAKECPAKLIQSTIAYFDLSDAQAEAYFGDLI